MVMPCSSPLRGKKTRALGIPVVDLSLDRSKVSELIVNACEEFGFFQVENHGVSREIISTVEMEGRDFFSKPACEKQRARAVPPTPFGYGCKNIGFNGDKGELEYVLLETDPLSVSERSKSLSTDPTKFSCAVNDYIQAVKNLTCDILEMVAEGLWVQDKSIFSNLIRDANTDSCFRINHYPSSVNNNDNGQHQLFNGDSESSPKPRIGFGEHTDPQILTVLRSNNVGGLQILSRDGFWIPIPPDSDKFCVFVGDAFEAMTNGRFVSVRHRAMANSAKTRMSMMYFAAPPLNARVSPVPKLVSMESPCLFRPFTWGEYKSAMYTLRLADNRLDMFRK